MNRELKSIRKTRVALVQYWLVSYRGGEQILRHVMELFDEVDVYTLFAKKSILQQVLADNSSCKVRVYTSVLDFPWLRKHYQKLFILYPLGIRSLRLRKDYDLLFSFESGPSRGIPNPKKIPHICYVHTPMRYCYGFTSEYTISLPFFIRAFARFLLSLLRRWDQSIVDHVDLYLTNSNNVRRRILLYYKRKSQICDPPIQRDWFSDSGKFRAKGITGKRGTTTRDETSLDVYFIREKKSFFLSLGALVPYKRIDLLVETFLDQKKNKNRNLLIVGSGSEKQKLERRIQDAPNIRILEYVPRVEYRQLLNQAQAFLFPGEEDFGLTVIEAMSQGLPVIAYGKGGALETVQYRPKEIQRSTGIFFREQTMQSLQRAIVLFEKNQQLFRPAFIRKQSLRYHPDLFQKKIRNIVQDVLQKRFA